MHNSFERGAETSQTTHEPSINDSQVADRGQLLDLGLAADRAYRRRAQDKIVEQWKERLHLIDRRLDQIQHTKEGESGDWLTILAIVAYFFSPAAFPLTGSIGMFAAAVAAIFLGFFAQCALPWLLDSIADHLLLRRAKVNSRLTLEQNKNV